jgi:hypothetical protein
VLDVALIGTAALLAALVASLVMVWPWAVAVYTAIAAIIGLPIVKVLKSIGCAPITSVDDAEVKGHLPKPIVLVTKDVTPSTLPIQQFNIGQFLLLAVPAEFTSMAGWMLKKELLAVHRALYGTEYVALAGYANAYAQYVTTKAEYDLQHYEGASTLFGPHTLEAYVQEFKVLARTDVDGPSFDTQHALEIAKGDDREMYGLRFYRVEREPMIDPSFETALVAMEPLQEKDVKDKKFKDIWNARRTRRARYECRFVDVVEALEDPRYAGEQSRRTIGVLQRRVRPSDGDGEGGPQGPIHVTALAREDGVSLFNVLGSRWSNLGCCERFKSFWSAGLGYSTTLQTVAVDDRLFLVGRGEAGLDVYEWNASADEGGAWEVFSHAKDNPPGVGADRAGWKSPQYYETARVVVLSGQMYWVARGHRGVQLWRFEKDAPEGRRVWTSITNPKGRLVLAELSNEKGWGGRKRIRSTSRGSATTRPSSTWSSTTCCT